MGSKSYSTSSASDQRQALSEAAVGISGNNSSLSKTDIDSSTTNTTLNSNDWSNRSVSVNTLDGEAIGKAFDFADNAMSAIVANSVNAAKQSAAAVSAAQAGAEAAQTGAEAAQTGAGMFEAIGKFKQPLLLAALGIGAWLLWGRKK